MQDNASAETAEAAAGGFPIETAEEWRNFFEKFGANGRTYQDFTQLTPESMEAIYMVAYNLYNGAKYDEAEKVFRLLSMLNHFEKRYWTGLGACREMQKKYDDALKAFGFLVLLDMEDPMPQLLCAKCFMALGKVDDAMGALVACIHYCGAKPEHADLKQQAEGLLELMNKAKGNN